MYAELTDYRYNMFVVKLWEPYIQSTKKISDIRRISSHSFSTVIPTSICGFIVLHNLHKRTGFLQYHQTQ